MSRTSVSPPQLAEYENDLDTEVIYEEEDMTSEDDDEIHDTIRYPTSLWSIGKFITILSSYGLTFVTMVQFAFWLADSSRFKQSDLRTAYMNSPIISWFMEIFMERDYLNSNLLKLINNIGLLVTFVLQHSLLSSRFLKATRVWYWLRYQCGIDKPLYLITTGLCLQMLMRYWEIIPIKVWDVELVETNYQAMVIVHCLAWASIYGTTLMLDLPEMIGLTQVIIQSPTLTVKSPEYQMMVQTQRHMGLLPLLFIFLTYPYMSLDRFLLTIFLTTYLCRQWSSDSAYSYVKNMSEIKRQKLFL